MKKFIIILFMLLLTACEKTSILNTVYISSIGIDYVDNEYIGYFYSPPAKDLSKDTSGDDESVVYVVKENELTKLFFTMFDSDPVNVNMLHLKTMILSENFKDVDVLLDYFKYSYKISYNFHVFVTQDDLSEIYKYKSISNISNLYNFLNSPSLIDYDEHGVSKCHFLNFANNYENEYRYNMIPIVKIEKNSLKEDEFQLRIDGYSNLEYIYNGEDYKGICLLYNVDKQISVDNNVVLLNDYNINFKCINNIYILDISFYLVNVSGYLNIKDYIVNELYYYFTTMINNEGSINLIDQYNYLYKQNIDNKTYQININIK